MEASLVLRVTSFVYHDVLADDGVDDSGFPGADAAYYKLSEAHFRHQLSIISARASPDQRGRISGSRSVPDDGHLLVISIDDGGASGCARTADILEELGWRGHFFAVS